MHLEDLQALFFKYFLRPTSIKRVSADKMMVKARGPVWPQHQKKQGKIPDGLTGLDRDATWSYSWAAGGVYGHGTCSLVSPPRSVGGLFQWMPNSAHEAKRLKAEIIKFSGLVKQVGRDSKAEDQKLYRLLKREHRMQLLTVARQGMDKPPARKKRIQERQTAGNRTISQQRKVTGEPRQGLVQELFELETCWLRGDESNRWWFAARGSASQIAQHRAYRRGTSTWNIKEEVLGL